MKEAPLILRWGIPGTVFFGAFFFFIIFDVLIQYPLGTSDQHLSILKRFEITQFFKDFTLIEAVAFVIGGSIPVGFIISQLYYFGYWTWLPFRTRRTIAKLLTSKTEIEKTIKAIKLYKLIKIEERDEGKLRNLTISVLS